MSDSSKQKKYKEIGGYVYGGSIITGMGIGFATNSIPAGVIIGLGVALLIMALLRYRWSN